MSTKDQILQQLATLQPHTRTCANTRESFEITQEDLEMYRMFAVPLPTLCPKERAKRRLAFRNERNFYKRTCDATGKTILSLYAPGTPYVVYDKDYWWSDHWDARDFGKDYDPTRPFFEQFGELMKAVPHQNLIGANNENSDYVNLAADCKDSYMIIESSNNENCLYGYWLQICKDSVDCSFCLECEFCYECDNCKNCYNLHFSWDSRNCADSSWLRGCRNVKNSIGCVGLENKEWCIMNEELGKEEFEKQLPTLDRQKIQEFVENHSMNYSRCINAENSTGDFLENVKDCFACVDAYDAEHCRYGEHIWRGAKDIMDASTAGRDAQLEYEVLNCALNAYDVQFSIQGWNSRYLRYCYECNQCDNLFGCTGMKNAKYCILNKQYMPEEYEILKEQITKDMLARGEYGEFFPPALSPFGYNETAAHVNYPLVREEALAAGFHWNDQLSQPYSGPSLSPMAIEEYADEAKRKELLGGVLTCAATGKAYKIIAQELAFLLQKQLPIPMYCPDERHKRRMERRQRQ